MKIYILTHNKLTDAGCEWDYKLFTTGEAAKGVMCQELKNTLEACRIANADMAYRDEFWDEDSKRDFIWNGKVCESWSIEDQDLDIKVAVKVHGGMVQSAIANADVDLDIYDLDISDFPDEGEEDEAEARKREFEELASRQDWRSVW